MLFGNLKLKKDFNNALKLENNGNYERASEIFESLIKKNYKVVESYFHLSKNFYEMKKFERSLIYIDKYLNINPTDINGLTEKSLSL